MGTAKRERQKANRAQKQTEMVRAEQRRKGTRIAIIVIGAIVAVFGLVWIASNVLGEDDPSPTTDDALVEPDTSLIESATLPEADTATTVSTEPVATADVGCPPTDGSAEPLSTFSGPPPDCLEPGATYSALVTTNKGEFTIALDAVQAPQTVNNFVFLARWKYYDDTVCHRIIPGFVVQCGDPTATGTGDPGYSFADELPSAGQYKIGSVAMANSGPDTNGSQFFVITGDQGAALPPQYSLFGDVTAGFDETVTAMEAAGTEAGAPSEEIRIISIEIVQS